MTRYLYERLRAEVLALKRQTAILVTGGSSGGSHASTHEDSGADEIDVTGLSGQLADAQLVGVRKNSAGSVFTRSRLNLIEGANVSLTVADDPGNGEVDVTVAATGAGGGSGGGNDTTTAAYASRPAAGNVGDLFFPSNGYVVERDTGAAWAPWGPIFPLTAPDDSAFAWVNQGGASTITTNGGIHLIAPAVAALNIRARVKSAPSTPYTITACFLGRAVGVNSANFGLLFRESGTGEIHVFEVIFSTDWRLGSEKYTSATAASASYTLQPILSYMPCPLWLRIADDGANRICSWSMDGQNWMVIHTIGRTDFLTADQVGFYAQAVNATWDCACTLISWKEA